MDTDVIHKPYEEVLIIMTILQRKTGETYAESQKSVQTEDAPLAYRTKPVY